MKLYKYRVWTAAYVQAFLFARKSILFGEDIQTSGKAKCRGFSPLSGVSLAGVLGCECCLVGGAQETR